MESWILHLLPSSPAPWVGDNSQGLKEPQRERWFWKLKELTYQKLNQGRRDWSQLTGEKILLASRRQGASPWARSAGGRRSRGEAGAGRGRRWCRLRSCPQPQGVLAAPSPGAPSLGRGLRTALHRWHVCRPDAAPGAHLPRDVRPLHLDLPHGGAAGSPPWCERQRQSKRVRGLAHPDGRADRWKEARRVSRGARS